MLTTWRIPYDHVEAQNKDATRLLRLWSFLSSSDLDFGLLAAVNEELDDHRKPHWLKRLTEDELAFSRVVRLLRRYSLIDEKEQSSKLATHAVLHEWCFYICRAGDEEEVKRLWEVAAMVVAVQAPADKSESIYWQRARQLLPHASS